MSESDGLRKIKAVLAIRSDGYRRLRLSCGHIVSVNPITPFTKGENHRCRKCLP